MRNRQWLLLAIILAAAAASYLPAMRGEFITDEYLLILNNPKVQHPQSLKVFIPDKFWTGKSRGIYYRPLIILSYALNWKISRTATLSYHLLNLVFYLGSIILVFGLARKWIPQAALPAAALFALHPVHSESVGWIPGRTDVMAGFFVLAAWLCWTRSGDRRGVKLIVIYIAIALLTALGLLCKEIAILCPALFLVSDWWTQGRESPLKNLILKRALGYLALAGVIFIYLWLRHNSLSGPGPEPAPAFLAGTPLWQKPLFIFRIWSEYLRLLVFPHPLITDAFYSNKFRTEVYPLWPCALSSVFWLAALAGIAVGILKRNPFAVLGVLFLLALLPVSHLIPFPNVMAERFLFLPSVFYSFALALAASRLTVVYPTPAKALLTLAFALFFVMTFTHNRIYKDRLEYLREAVSQVPEGPAIHNQLGIAAMDRGWLDYAEHQFTWALVNNADYPEVMVNLALVELKKGNANSAINLLQKAVSITPDYGDAYYNLGLAFKKLGRSDDAKAAFMNAVRYTPEHPAAAFEVAQMDFEQGNLGEAKTYADKALDAAPWHVPALKIRLKIALAEEDRGTAEEMLSHLEKIDGNDPEIPQLRNALGR